MLINSDAARIRADAARIRADAARIRADAAEDQVRVAARERARQRVLEFFGRLPPPIWGTLFYFALSFTGAIYSWALYQQFDIQIFYFFSTPDFLLSAFQKLGLLSIGVGTTLFVIFMSAYLAYNSSIYRAFRRNKEEQRTLVYQEASIFLVVLLAVPAGILLLFLWPWQDGGFNKSVLPLTMLLLLGIGVLANHFVKFISPSGSENGPEQQSRDGLETGILLALLPTISLGIVLSWWFWRDNVFSEPVLPLTIPLLLGIGVLVYFAYHFIKLVYKSISGTRQQPLRSWQAGILPELLPVISLLIGIVFSWWFRWDNVFSKTALPLTIPLLLGIGILICFAYHFTKLVRTPSDGVGQQALSRWQPVTLLGILLAVSLGGIPYYWGLAAGEEKKTLKNKELVRVAIRLDVDQPQIRLPDALLIGTTSGFHFFYESENDQENKKGRPFIVPTANLASLEFISDSESLPSQASLLGVLEEVKHVTAQIINAIDRIKHTSAIEKLSEIGLDLTEIVSSITEVNEGATAFSENTEKNTTIIVEEVEAISKKVTNISDSPEFSATIEALRKTVAGLKSYLEGNITITGLNATITELNAATDGLTMLERENHCASGWKNLETVGPFCESEHKLWEDNKQTNPANGNNPHHSFATSKKKLDCESGDNKQTNPTNGNNPMTKYAKLEESLRRKLQDYTLQQLMLIGRVDKKLFIGKKQEYYGSQRGLAQARAEWVQEQLLKNFSKEIDPGRITLLSDNYRYDGDNEEKHALDRSVEVHACWAPKPKQTTSFASAGSGD